jgi:hypothetical protein
MRAVKLTSAARLVVERSCRSSGSTEISYKQPEGFVPHCAVVPQFGHPSGWDPSVENVR